ncbi:thioredoxin family protein [Achromobacter sp. UMC71]|uniref:thioredoxin family protein n=1 Tax=Achromobacter sp. UMC71 TaxID=1862320 RepID=UPI0016044EB3|nr:thioredoxin family protein [Achromobacter sp. UMC71]MBB1628118.1 thiol reductase thioredoxin [Achromobacter sp. UMC71]
MTLLVPGSDLSALRAQLAASPQAWLVACFCAAWCDTCEEYKPKLRTLSGTFRQHVFAWIDIEDHAELLGEVDVENFPTLLVQIGGRVVFYGPMLPHIGHLERLLESLDEHSPVVTSALPDLPRLLAA